MSNKSVNLSANEVLDNLNLTLPASWTSEGGELDVVCINSPRYEIGYIVTLNMDSCKGYSFTVHEFVMKLSTGDTNESSNDFLTYDEVLNFIRTKVDAYVNAA